MDFKNTQLIVILLLVLSLTGCAHGRKCRTKSGCDLFQSKLYVHDAHRGLFIRDLKDKDVLTYKEGHGLICTSEKDFRKLIDEAIVEKAYKEQK